MVRTFLPSVPGKACPHANGTLDLLLMLGHEWLDDAVVDDGSAVVGDGEHAPYQEGTLKGREARLTTQAYS